jgi:hypothetical protein
MASCVSRCGDALLVTAACVVLLATVSAWAQAPPFFGSGFVDSDIILATDYSYYESIGYVGLEDRLVFDRRDNAFSIKSMHIFDATYADGLEIEVQVNPEFGDSAAAEVHATTYAQSVGLLSTSLREDVETMWIHDGFEAFGGGNNNILIHVPQAIDYGEFLEEILFHEATHTSYDADHGTSAGWLAAQAADPTFISNYAQDNPTREDVAESLLMWFAVRHRANRIDSGTTAEIEAAIPNRLAYFDGLPFVIPEPSLGGDYNEDGVVNAADYVLWRNNVGSGESLPNDDTGGVAQDDYERWVSNFGMNATGATAPHSARARPTAIPEPTVAWGLILALAIRLAARHATTRQFVPPCKLVIGRSGGLVPLDGMPPIC